MLSALRRASTKPRMHGGRLILGITLAFALWLPGAGFAQAIDENLWVANDAVYAVVRDGGTIYIGGTFDYVGPPTGGGGPIDITTGALNPSFPRVDGFVMAAVSDGAGGWYIGGLFTAVDGIPRPNVARIASDLSVTAWNPGANSAVRALAVSGSTVYAGGDFTNIGGQARNRIAALDATTGAATGWDPVANSVVYALAVSGSTVYAGGAFTNIGGQARNYIAALDATTGNATGWNPSAGYVVYALAVSGTTVYAGGQFNTMGVSTRNYIAAIDAATGTATGWDPNANSNVYALAASGTKVYAGGFFTSIGGAARSRIAELDGTTGNATGWNPLSDNDVLALAVSGGVVYAGGNFTNIGGQARSRVAAIDASTGAATAWNPGAGARVEALAVSGSAIYVGGILNTIGGRSRRGIAALDAATGTAMAWNVNCNGPVVAIATNGSTVFAAGGFTFIGGQPRNRLAALDAVTGIATSWNPNPNIAPSALALSGATLYVGGNFTFIASQPRNRVAAFDVPSGTLLSWNPNSNGTVMALAAVKDATVYASGTFTTIGGSFRNYLAALDGTTGAAIPWNPNPDGWVTSLALSGTTVYAGGSFFTIGGQSRWFIAALDATTGNATAWNPTGNGEVKVLAVSGSTVYAGGDFTSIGGQARNRIAALNAATGSALAWDPNANGTVRALGMGGAMLYAGGDFTSIATPPRERLVGIQQVHAIADVEPNQGGDAGPVSVVVSGVGFQSGATAKLVRSGQPDIVGSQVSVAADGRSVSATFNLAGKAQGVWDVVVTNPDLTFASLPNGFTIESLAAPQLRVDIIGPATARTGYATAYDVVLQNPGNVDALAVPLWIAGIPTNATVKLDFTLTAAPQYAGEPDWSQLPDTLTSAAGRYLALVIPRVPPGTTVRRIYLTVPSAGSFQLTAATTPPWVDGTPFRACIADGGIVSNTACMGAQLTSINIDLVPQTTMQALNGIGVWAKIGWQCEGAGSLPAALAEARQALDFMLRPVEQQGTIPPSCNTVLAPRWREVLAIVVGGSFDPNDKIGNRGTGSAITSQQILSYSIRFENLSSALFPAQQVVVSDVLDPDLDPATVSLGTITFGKNASGSPYHLFPPPGQSSYAGSVDLRPSQNLIVNVNAILSGNTLNWYFSSVDPNGQPLPPDAGFLPPNQNPPGGEGSVVFTVRPRSGLPSGTQIANAASLIFDDNPAMNTPAWTNSLDDTPPASHVQTLGTPQGSPSFTVNWTADGAPSDLRDFTVCVSEDGGPYRAWRLNTTATSDTFAAAGDHQPHTYAFYSVARDQIGNMEAPPPAPDAQTTSTTDVDGTGPWTLALAGARPNPALGAAHVWFTLPSDDPAVLEMLDIAGRRVLLREVGSLGPGPHMVTLDSAPSLKSGLYFLRLAQGEHVLRARVVLIR